MSKLIRFMVWLAVAFLGAGAYAGLAFRRDEPVNAIYLLVAALCSYAVGYRLYSKWIAARVLVLADRRATPCEVHEDGRDFVRTNPWIVFGHHFAAISGPGPLVGPVLAAQFGYLPGTLWLLIGCVLGGAVQDFVILFCSMRREGRSLAQMVREEIHPAAGALGVVAILSIMVILLAVLALVVVKVLAESPWGVFTVGATIPIALLMGGYLRYVRVGRVLEVSALGVALLLLAVWGGQHVQANAVLAEIFSLREEPLAWTIIGYGFAASVLPVWLLLAPRDYLSTFMKLGTILALALGVFLVLPDLKMPAVTRFLDGTGPVVPGTLFPFCFITIACGAISGFHALISSGVTPKIITRERHARIVGYGAMCLESLVAIMAMIAACTLDPGVYFGMNVGDPNPDLEARATAIVAKVRSAGFEIEPAQMTALAEAVKEKSLYGRTGGAATLAVGMARIFSTVTGGRWLDLWYHFAIMFEALFILTTLDAGTRVGRYMLQDALGSLWKPLGEMRRLDANLLASGLMVGGWGFFLILGVRDPEGGVKALWPLFGIANQMLAAIALGLATTVLLKMQLHPRRDGAPPGRPSFALITFLPLVWLVAVTATAGVQKIGHPDPRIGFLAQARQCREAIDRAQGTLRGTTDAAGRTALEQTIRVQSQMLFNQRVDAIAAGAYLLMLVAFLGMCAREWFRLLRGSRPADLRETPAVWLPEAAVAEGGPRRRWFGWLALTAALLRELSGEAAWERERHAAAWTPKEAGEQAHPCELTGAPEDETSDGQTLDRRAYDRALDRKYKGINRCC